MVSEKTKLIALTLITGYLFRAADPQEPFSPIWWGLLFGCLLSGVFLIRVLRQYQST